MRCSDSLPPVSPCFVYRLAIPTDASVFVSPIRSGADLRAWSFTLATPQSHFTTGNDRVSQVPGEPFCAYAVLSDPGRTGCSRPIRCIGMASVHRTTKAPTRGNFGAQSHGLNTRCLRFVRWVARTRRKTRFRLLAKLCRTGLNTRRVRLKGFEVILTSRPPFPGFAWRNPRPLFQHGCRFCSA